MTAVPAEASDKPLVLGVIGCGNMGRAIIAGVRNSPVLRERFSLLAYARSETSASEIREMNIPLTSSALELAHASDIILTAVKPYQMQGLLEQIRPALSSARNREHPDWPHRLLLSIAAGVTLENLRAMLAQACPAVRTMPNTLVAVGEGLFGLCFDNSGRGPSATQAQKDAARHLLGGLGQVVELEEDKLNAFTALAGCGPAYVFHFMESLAEAGVSVGLSRESSLSIALSLMRGCVGLAGQTGLHPAPLREQVTSPGGMTIAAVNHLDRRAARGILVDAVLAAMERGRAMEKQEEAAGGRPASPRRS